MTCDNCGGDHELEACPYPSTNLGCCASYFECYWCDALFCQHGYLLKTATPTKVVPWKKLCPRCQAQSDEDTKQEEALKARIQELKKTQEGRELLDKVIKEADELAGTGPKCTCVYPHDPEDNPNPTCPHHGDK